MRGRSKQRRPMSEARSWTELNGVLEEHDQGKEC